MVLKYSCHKAELSLLILMKHEYVLKQNFYKALISFFTIMEANREVFGKALKVQNKYEMMVINIL